MIREKYEEIKNRPGIYREIASWLALAVILLPFLIYAFPQAIGAQDALVVKSGSMEPTIPTGSVIVITPVNGSGLEKNDIITYQSGTDQGEPVYTTHRIIEVERGEEGVSYTTKGDNNEDPDPESVPPEDVYGKHLFTVPQMGFVLNFIRGGNGIFALILIPAVLLIINELYKISKEVYGIKSEGKDKELIQTVLIAVAGLIILFSGLFLSGTGSELLQNVGAGLEIDSTLFGVLIMAAMLLAMVILKFI